MNLLQKELDATLQTKRRSLMATAFHLYETDGFPREITEEIIAEWPED